MKVSKRMADEEKKKNRLIQGISDYIASHLGGGDQLTES